MMLSLLFLSFSLSLSISPHPPRRPRGARGEGRTAPAPGPRTPWRLEGAGERERARERERRNHSRSFPSLASPLHEMNVVARRATATSIFFLLVLRSRRSRPLFSSRSSLSLHHAALFLAPPADGARGESTRAAVPAMGFTKDRARERREEEQEQGEKRRSVDDDDASKGSHRFFSPSFSPLSAPLPRLFLVRHLTLSTRHGQPSPPLQRQSQNKAVPNWKKALTQRPLSSSSSFSFFPFSQLLGATSTSSCSRAPRATFVTTRALLKVRPYTVSSTDTLESIAAKRGKEGRERDDVGGRKKREREERDKGRGRRKKRKTKKQKHQPHPSLFLSLPPTDQLQKKTSPSRTS